MTSNTSLICFVFPILLSKLKYMIANEMKFLYESYKFLSQKSCLDFGNFDGGRLVVLAARPGLLALIINPPSQQRILFMHRQKWIGIIRFHVCEGVVDVSMVSFIGHHTLERVDPLGVAGKAPISDSNRWRR